MAARFIVQSTKSAGGVSCSDAVLSHLLLKEEIKEELRDMIREQTREVLQQKSED